MDHPSGTAGSGPALRPAEHDLSRSRPSRKADIAIARTARAALLLRIRCAAGAAFAHVRRPASDPPPTGRVIDLAGEVLTRCPTRDGGTQVVRVPCPGETVGRARWYRRHLG